MPTEILGNVTNIPQEKDGLCWFASARMLYEWTIKARGAANGMIDPKVHEETKDMAKFNRGFPYGQVHNLRDWLKMKDISVTWEYDPVSAALKKYGPLWVAGHKGYYHVYVVRGVADTGVLMQDPEPVGQGTYQWITWDSVKKFVTAKDDIDINVLVCP